MSFKRAGLVACALFITTMLLSGCGGVPENILFTVTFNENQRGWVKDGEDHFLVLKVRNDTSKDMWITIPAFEGDCFSFKGYGPWIEDWGELGKIPPDNKFHRVSVQIIPRVTCKEADYYLVVEARTNQHSTKPISRFRTDHWEHLGTKSFTAATTAASPD